MFTKPKFDELPAGVRSRIIEDSIAMANGEPSHHSLKQLVEQKRLLAIAARMTSRPLQWEKKEYVNGEIQSTGEIKAYTGKDIANIFIDSAKYGGTYYPVTGDWSHIPIEQLVLFTKEEDGYVPYVRFEVKEVELNEGFQDKHLISLTDITPALACAHKSLLKICNPQIDDLPQYYLGLRSRDELQKVAFKGPAANILMI